MVTFPRNLTQDEFQTPDLIRKLKIKVSSNRPYHLRLKLIVFLSIVLSMNHKVSINGKMDIVRRKRTTTA